MPSALHTFLLAFHISCGCIVLPAGLLQVVLPKGGKLHLWIGRIYFWCITGVIISGSIIGSLAITLMGVFGYYYALSGYRYARLKARWPLPFDRILIILGMCICVGMLGTAVYFYIRANLNFAILLTLFGFIFAGGLAGDFRKHILKRTGTDNKGGRKRWFQEHYVRVYISYIMALTAFSAINHLFNVILLDWTLPTVIGTLAISFTRRYYAKTDRQVA